VSQDKKRLENLGIIGRQQQQKQLSSNQEENAGDKINDDEEGGDGGGAGQIVRGVINDLAVFERGERGKDGLCVVVGLGTEHKFGRWKCVKGGKNGAVVFEVPSLVNKDGQGQGQEQEGRFEEEEEKGENEKAE
ncbi:pre-rRNA processing protein, partial [Peltigera leucophlebia]|nr:pre-rRNA processing protein [Peltigera leucophlebia]